LPIISFSILRIFRLTHHHIIICIILEGVILALICKQDFATSKSIFINIFNKTKNQITKLSSKIAFLIIFVSSLLVCQLYLSAQDSRATTGNQAANQLSLTKLGTRFEAVGGIFSLPSINCLGCEFRGMIEKLSESQYSIRGEVVADSISTIIPVSVLGTLNVNRSMLNGTLTISDKQYNIEGTSTTYSPTCSYCKQTLDLRGRSVQGDDVISANIPMNSVN
jgi:hypothetical protein